MFLTGISTYLPRRIHAPRVDQDRVYDIIFFSWIISCSINGNGNAIFRSIQTHSNPSHDSLALLYRCNTSIPSFQPYASKFRLHANDTKNYLTADNFQTRAPNAVKSSVRGAQHPPSSNGTINGPKAAKFVKQLNSTWVQLSDNMSPKSTPISAL